jgi:hypothetical protein
MCVLRGAAVTTFFTQAPGSGFGVLNGATHHQTHTQVAEAVVERAADMARCAAVNDRAVSRANAHKLLRQSVRQVPRRGAGLQIQNKVRANGRCRRQGTGDSVLPTHAHSARLARA